MRIGLPVSARAARSRASPTSATFVVMKISAKLKAAILYLRIPERKTASHFCWECLAGNR
jgi:hypothetical protein